MDETYGKKENNLESAQEKYYQQQIIRKADDWGVTVKNQLVFMRHIDSVNGSHILFWVLFAEILIMLVLFSIFRVVGKI